MEKCGIRYQIWNSSHYNSVVTSKASHMMIYATIKSQSDLYVYIYFGVPCLLFGCHYQTTQAKRSVHDFVRGLSNHRVVKEPPLLSTLGNEINFPKIHSKTIWSYPRFQLWGSHLRPLQAFLNFQPRFLHGHGQLHLSKLRNTVHTPSTLLAGEPMVTKSSTHLSQSTADAPKWISPKIIHIGIKLKLVGHLNLFRYNISHLSWKLVQTVPQLVLYLCFDLAAQTIPKVSKSTKCTHAWGNAMKNARWMWSPWHTVISNGERVSNYTIQSDLYDLQSMIKYDSK